MSECCGDRHEGFKPGSYCCLDYSQIYDVTRYRLHHMKEAMKESLKCKETIEAYICAICRRSYTALDAVHLISSNGDTFHCEICKGELVAQNGDGKARRGSRSKSADVLERMKEQLRPIELQLNILKTLPVPDFGTLEQWAQSNAVEFVVDSLSKNIGETEVDIDSPKSSAEQADSSYTGVKILPLWIVQKGMTLTKAGKGKQGSDKDERQVGKKYKRSHGGSASEDCDVFEIDASTRRRI